MSKRGSESRGTTIVANAMPNKGMELTASSVRCAPAFGSSSYLALGVMTKRFPIPHETLPMADEARGYLIRQFETAWKLTNFHLDGLTTAECWWRPAHEGLHVQQVPGGGWRADWPDHEG